MYDQQKKKKKLTKKLSLNSESFLIKKNKQKDLQLLRQSTFDNNKYIQPFVGQFGQKNLHSIKKDQLNKKKQIKLVFFNDKYFEQDLKEIVNKRKQQLKYYLVKNQNQGKQQEGNDVNKSTQNENYKTEICKNFQQNGFCKFGTICQFAHGKQELRSKEKNNNLYKTKICKQFFLQNFCPYGYRCQYKHIQGYDQDTFQKYFQKIKKKTLKKSLKTSILQVSQNFRRLKIFRSICKQFSQ